LIANASRFFDLTTIEMCHPHSFLSTIYTHKELVLTISNMSEAEEEIILEDSNNDASTASSSFCSLVAAAAAMDFNWSGAGITPGVQIWRVENKRTANDNPNFGINAWPQERYGQFYRGDSYIVLLTSEGPSGVLLWDIFFWIGSESSQDEYGVAAYKSVELDDLLGGSPVQHREVEGNESKLFVNCFPDGITYMEGGIASGFRRVADLENNHTNRLFRLYKKDGERVTRCFEVPLDCSSLNEDDAFLLDAGDKIFTWFGASVSAFERNKSASVAHNIKEKRLGSCDCILDVGNEDENFWRLLGGKGEITSSSPAPVKEAEEEESSSTEEESKKMYVLSDVSGSVKITAVPFSKASLVSDDVCIIHVGDSLYVWVGKGSNKTEQQQAMMRSYQYLKAVKKNKTTRVTRVMEGQEDRSQPFWDVF
jgi:hypothetical protein